VTMSAMGLALGHVSPAATHVLGDSALQLQRKYEDSNEHSPATPF
jgi:hypothetical protein